MTLTTGRADVLTVSVTPEEVLAGVAERRIPGGYVRVEMPLWQDVTRARASSTATPLELLSLTSRELQVFTILRDAQRPVSGAEMLKSVWGDGRYWSRNIHRALLTRLRRKLPALGWRLVNLRPGRAPGAQYRLERVEDA